MKQIMLALALLTAAPAAALQAAPSTPTQAAQAVQRWEYATIMLLTGSRFYVLRMPDRDYSGANMAAVAQAFLGRPVQSNEAPLYLIPQRLGELGWEMVSVSADDNSTTYWFKRPKN